MNGIMIQGTASGAGKSLIVTGLCRLFARNGYNITPFKAQNMSDSSAMTNDGKEIGIGQMQQAEAANLSPATEMNPVLLKVLPEAESAVFLLGERKEILPGSRFREKYHKLAKETIRKSLYHLETKYGALIMEGAGSPVEMNLKKYDLANMQTAEMADVPVILTADISMGGAFASITGTLQLFSPKEKARVKGLLINKFKGDPDSFASGIKWLEKHTGIPVLGVIPYICHKLIEEDSAGPQQPFLSPEARNIEYEKLADHLAKYIDFRAIRAITFGEQK
jgi:adenosylcobyric acid synthase